ncbi:hypothetical protein RHS04_06842 [Rhizoctonia solani]|uniref:Uncharacterized protein n=1 Tax=Rhizoctonia solani TaxID=456999 RepID=A0A8H7H4C4_9AGAM|nr:hypothetical protein RHS04_06842 [Rhizoctonia solani]
MNSKRTKLLAPLDLNLGHNTCSPLAPFLKTDFGYSQHSPFAQRKKSTRPIDRPTDQTRGATQFPQPPAPAPSLNPPNSAS